MRSIKKIGAASALALVLLASTLLHASAATTPAFKQSKAVEVSKGTTASVAFTSANTVGDLIVVQVLWSNTGAVTLTDSRGNTYTAATARSTWSGDNSAQTFYAKNVAAGTNTVTAKFATTLSSYAIVQAHEYSGLDKTNPLDGTSSGVGTSATANSGNVTTTGSSDLLFAGGGALGALGTPPTGWTARLNTSGNRTADKITTAAGTYNFTSSATGNQWVMQLVAFKADSGSTDTTAPTAPGSLQATAASSSQINLSWTAATDNVGVTGYQLERCQGASCANFASLATLGSGVLTYGDTGLTSATSYSYRLRAVDAAGNQSAYSAVATAATPAIVDTTAPSTPANLTAQAASASQVNLSWTASTDNVGVTGYKVYRDGTYLIATAAGATSYQDQNLAAGTTYSYTLSAVDAAGNESAQSAAAAATTQTPDTTAPVAALTAPNDGDTVSGTVSIAATASDNASGVADVQFFLDGTLLNDDVSAPYTYQWNTSSVANGDHQLTVLAKDVAGNVSAPSTAITVHVNNVNTPPSTLKIMPLGDSLTQGGVGGASGLNSTTVNGYRLNLLNLLTGYNVDYVGPYQLGDSSLHDQDLAGESGACIMVTPCGAHTMYPLTAGWLNTYNPDLVIMQGGGNDYSKAGTTDQDIESYLEQWIQLVWQTKPNAKIIVSGQAQWHPELEAMNKAYVESLQAQGKPIRFVPFAATVGIQSNTTDGTHPNANGYQVWANELAPMVRELFPKQ